MKPVGDISFPKMEEGVLEFWKQRKIFEAQEEQRKEAKEFSFFDGPPFANGMPHYGHLLATTIKDTVLRYWVMKGFKVDRRFGWDCHGLPVEFEIEKREKLKGRPDILKMGIGNFNETCRESVLVYTQEWQKTITRLGRWINWDHQYKTMDKDYMESVWWVFSELHKKGLIYKDFKVVPFSPRTSSVVSNFEANQNYKNIADPSVFVKVRLKGREESILVWTTTPWTLPSNLALAVGKDIEYVKVQDKKSSELWICAKATLGNVFGKGKEEAAYELLESFSGQELVGLNYEPIFPYFKDHKNAFHIFHADYVTTNEGTGVVHQAPAYGEDDFLLCKQHQIALVDPIDENGNFTRMVPDLEGAYFKDADKIVCKMLKDRGLLLKQETFTHSYPFDERTDTPLMYKAVPSWYVAVEKFVDRLVKNNQEIHWVPNHIRDGRMGSWLANARDWSISRNRFWGTPLPVWICKQNAEHTHVISSVAELEALSGKKVEDLHLHYIAEHSISCPTCHGEMKNEGLVFDCWFESGSMPYAQLHYPFEQEQRFRSAFPADFIAEGIDQTRGWFYTLHVLSTALFDRPAFKNVIVNGVILDESGKKMSKRHRNYTAPDDLIAQYGADSVRLYMLNSSLVRAEDLIFVDQGVKDVTRLVLLPIWNALSFFSTYAHADQWKPTKDLVLWNASYVKTLRFEELDLWLLSRLESLRSSLEEHMNAYKLYLVVPELVAFIDELTNWYIRLNRRRFWGEEEASSKASQEAAFATLYHTLLQLSKLMASFAPFLAERVYKELVTDMEAPESVHLCELPQELSSYLDKNLEHGMSIVRNIVENGRSLRQKHKMKIRQVLPSLTVISRNFADHAIVRKYEELILQELNVKRIDFTHEESKHVKLNLKPNLRTLGTRFGSRLKDFSQHLRELDEKATHALVSELEEHGSVSVLGESLVSEDFLITRESLDQSLIASQHGITILLDTKLTPELLAEGRARELVNRIQNLRKDSGLEVSDRIRLEILASESLQKDIHTHLSYLQKETIAKHVEVLRNGEAVTLKFVGSYEIDDMSCIIALEVAER